MLNQRTLERMERLYNELEEIFRGDRSINARLAESHLKTSRFFAKDWAYED